MKKIVILLFTLVSFLYSEPVNECVSDIYFANGVGAVSRFESLKQGKSQVDKYLKANPTIIPLVNKYDLAFNTGRGLTLDLYEAFLQYQEEHVMASLMWMQFKEFVSRAFKSPIAGVAIDVSDSLIKKLEKEDLSEQIKAYNDSIVSGHGVVILAHSQGKVIYM